MRKSIHAACVAVAAAALCAGCGHTQVSKVAVLSVGNLDGKAIPAKVNGPVLEGSTSARPGVMLFYLSDAVRDALKGTQFDTLVDAEVTTETGLLVPSNKIIVKGTAVSSKSLGAEGGKP